MCYAASTTLLLQQPRSATSHYWAASCPCCFSCIVCFVIVKCNQQSVQLIRGRRVRRLQASSQLLQQPILPGSSQLQEVVKCGPG